MANLSVCRILITAEGKSSGRKNPVLEWLSALQPIHRVSLTSAADLGGTTVTPAVNYWCSKITRTTRITFVAVQHAL